MESKGVEIFKEQVRDKLMLFFEEMTSKLESYGYTVKEENHLSTYTISSDEDIAEINLLPGIKPNLKSQTEDNHSIEIRIGISIDATPPEFADTLMSILSDFNNVKQIYN